MEALSAEERFALEPQDDLTPGLQYERAWARELLEQVLKKLEATYEATGQRAVFLALRDHITEGTAERSHQQVSSVLGMSEASVRFAAFKLRQRYREVLREFIGNTVAASAEIEDELAHMRMLFRSG